MNLKKLLAVQTLAFARIASGQQPLLTYLGADPDVLLDECEGDCDKDADCQGSLFCFQRSGFEPVPGCSGEGEDRKDYCYNPTCNSDPDNCGCASAQPHQQSDYIGTIATTQSGYTCQRWDTQSPHTHGFSSLEENYCRNPDGEPRAWCYTTDPNKRWELCSVPFCATTTETASPTANPSKAPTLKPVNGGTASPINPTNSPSESPSKKPTLSQIITNSPTKAPTARPINPTNGPTASSQVGTCPDPQSCGCVDTEQEEYSGTIAITKNGRTCQRWDAQEPHSHDRTAENYPNSGLEENYCRNPDGEPRAWCYTTDPNKRWELCNVPFCTEANPSTPGPTNSPTFNPSRAPTLSPVTDGQTKFPTRSPINPTNSPTANPSKAPTRKPSTASPIADSPTKFPTGNVIISTDSPTANPSKVPTLTPVTNSPTKSPSSSPATNSPTTLPTRSPINPTKSPSNAPTLQPVTARPTDECDVCLEAVPESECPSNPNIQKCYSSLTPIGGLCDGDGECGTDNFLNNCEVPGEGGYDVYRRVSCVPTPQPTAEPTQSPTTPPPTAQPTDECGCLEAVSSSECPSNPSIQQCYSRLTPIGGLCEGDGECETNTNLDNCDGYDVYRRVSCVPTPPPTDQPTQPPTTAQPSVSPTTMEPSKSPTPSPTPESVTNRPTDECGCLEAVPESECPNSPSIQNCYSRLTPIGALCEGDFECGTTNIDNCGAFDVYRRVECSSSNYYRYTTSGTSTCPLNGQVNIQGPAPFADKSNVALQFFAFGDTPYDRAANTCIGSSGQLLDPCDQYNCEDNDSLPCGNTCTYVDSDYDCVRDSIIPYMNRGIADGDAAFIAHCGDIIPGAGFASNKRCNEYSFASRRDLFSDATNFLLVPGDNDWNECCTYDINSNTDPIREVWRDFFARDQSFYQFSTDFPATAGFPGGSKPTIERKEPDNPEIYYFEHNQIAVFGLNRPARDSYISNVAPTDFNADWVREKLALDTNCELESIVLVAQALLKQVIYDRVDEYFVRCGRTLPTLTITGDTHPATYCMSKSNERVDLTIEASSSGPILVTVVRDPDGGNGDFLYASDSQLVESNSQCPEFQ